MTETTPSRIDFSEVFPRLAKCAGTADKKEMAALLRLSPQAFSHYFSCGATPYRRIVRLASERGWSLDYILLGNRPGESDA